MMIRSLFAAALAAFVSGVQVFVRADEPQQLLPIVSNVTMVQPAYSRKVQINYDLAEASAIITLSIETNGVAIPDSVVTRLEGDVSKEVAIGSGKTIVWDAGYDWPENLTEEAQAVITAWSLKSPPEVMVVDLRKGTQASSGNPYPINFYNSTDSLVYGVTNDLYKSELLVLKKLKNGSFLMGEGNTAKNTTVSNDFYIGVYQVTQGQ